MRKSVIVSLFFALTLAVSGQTNFGHRIGQALVRGQGVQANVSPYATIRVCTADATGNPCSPAATIYSDPGLTQPIVGGLTADASGNYDYYTAPGVCTLEQISAPGQGMFPLPNVCTINAGGGSGVVSPAPQFTVYGQTTAGTNAIASPTALIVDSSGNLKGLTSPTFSSPPTQAATNESANAGPIANVITVFGADPSGNTDPTAAALNYQHLQNAFDSCGDGKTYGALRIPAGNYQIIGRPLSLRTPYAGNLTGCNIICDGRASTIIQQQSANTPVLEVDNSGLVNSIGVSGCQLLGPTANPNTTTNINTLGVSINGIVTPSGGAQTYESTFSDLYFGNLYEGARTGGAGPRLSSFPFRINEVIAVPISGTTYMFTATTAGTSASSSPSYAGATAIGDTVTDGTAVFTNAGTQSQVDNFWAYKWQRIWADPSLSGGTFNFFASAGEPRCYFDEVYSQQTVNEPQIALYNCEVHGVHLESNNGLDTVYLFNGGTVDLSQSNIEAHTATYPNASGAVLDFNNARSTLRHVYIQSSACPSSTAGSPNANNPFTQAAIAAHGCSNGAGAQQQIILLSDNAGGGTIYPEDLSFSAYLTPAAGVAAAFNVIGISVGSNPAQSATIVKSPNINFPEGTAAFNSLTLIDNEAISTQNNNTLIAPQLGYATSGTNFGSNPFEIYTNRWFGSTPAATPMFFYVSANVDAGTNAPGHLVIGAPNTSNRNEVFEIGDNTSHLNQFGRINLNLSSSFDTGISFGAPDSLQAIPVAAFYTTTGTASQWYGNSIMGMQGGGFCYWYGGVLTSKTIPHPATANIDDELCPFSADLLGRIAVNNGSSHSLRLQFSGDFTPPASLELFYPTAGRSLMANADIAFHPSADVVTMEHSDGSYGAGPAPPSGSVNCFQNDGTGGGGVYGWLPCGGGGVSSIDGLTGAFTFTGSGVSHTGNAYTFSGTGSGIGSITWSLPSYMTASPTTISASGTQTFGFGSETQNLMFASPNGASGVPLWRALVAADLPSSITSNTSGTASNLSGTPALPNGTTATTQTVGDNTTKLATDAFVIANAGGGAGTVTHTAGALTANQMVIGNGAADVKVDTGCSTNGTGTETCAGYVTNGTVNGFDTQTYQASAAPTPTTHQVQFSQAVDVTTPYSISQAPAGSTGVPFGTLTSGIEQMSYKPLQGTDSNILSSGTISGTAATLCTDANGGATTVGCSSGGTSSGSVGSLQVAGASGAFASSGYEYALINAPTTTSITLSANCTVGATSCTYSSATGIPPAGVIIFNAGGFSAPVAALYTGATGTTTTGMTWIQFPAVTPVTTVSSGQLGSIAAHFRYWPSGNIDFTTAGTAPVECINCTGGYMQNYGASNFGFITDNEGVLNGGWKNQNFDFKVNSNIQEVAYNATKIGALSDQYGFQGALVGTAITAAATIAPVTSAFHTTGTTTINTVTQPTQSACLDATLSCEYDVVPNAVTTFGTTGNVATGGTYPAGYLLKGMYDQAQAKLYLPPPPALTATLTTTAAATDTVTLPSMTSTGHCSAPAPTNTAAATAEITTTAWVSTKAAGSVTVTHAVTASMTYDIVCWPY